MFFSSTVLDDVEPQNESVEDDSDDDQVDNEQDDEDEVDNDEQAEQEEEPEEDVDEYLQQFTPIERTHLFIWNIYNIIRNIDIIKQWKGKKSTLPSIQGGLITQPNNTLVLYNKNPL
ncbi:E3 ubiquitin-protein ligase HECTD [Acrasis kona]|uniref:E3 ubiquitin-protein ligase HECTD n=1 Tax=Acrasis kona TaxID=1008807 RepID=A0AAW2YWN2_9EUKA